MTADPGVAYLHYRRAAELGRPKAALNVGLAHDNGILDQDVDKETAREFYQIAADAGERRAMTNLAMLYLTSDAVPPDEVTVLDLLERARDLGDELAGEVLGQLMADVDYEGGAFSLNRPADPQSGER